MLDSWTKASDCASQKRLPCVHLHTCLYRHPYSGHTHTSVMNRFSWLVLFWEGYPTPTHHKLSTLLWTKCCELYFCHIMSYWGMLLTSLGAWQPYAVLSHSLLSRLHSHLCLFLQLVFLNLFCLWLQNGATFTFTLKLQWLQDPHLLKQHWGALNISTN